MERMHKQEAFTRVVAMITNDAVFVTNAHLAEEQPQPLLCVVKHRLLASELRRELSLEPPRDRSG